MAKLYYIFASVILVMATVLISLTSGCERAKNSESFVDVAIPWDFPEDAENECPRMEISPQGEYCKSNRLMYSVCEKVVDGKKYFGIVAHNESVVVDGKNAAESVVVEFIVRRLRTPRENMDIHLSCKASVRLDIVDFEGGILTNVDNGKKIAKPFILAPGTYHLQAFKE